MLKRYKWLFILVLSLGLIVGFTALHSQKANAAETTTISASVDVVKAAPAAKAPSNFSGRVITPLWTLSNCYLAMGGYTWCLRNNCTTFEYWAMGCRNNTWYQVPRVWYV